MTATTDPSRYTPAFLDEDGTVTDDAVIVFTTEYCWYLAWVLHQITDWPIVAVTDGSLHTDGGTEWNHVLVLHPSGNVLDATGLHDAEDKLDEWGILLEMDLPWGSESVLETIRAEDFRSRLSSDPDSVTPQFAAATRALAEALVRLHPSTGTIASAA